MSDPLVKRASDPASSQLGVNRVKVSIADVRAAAQRLVVFTDEDLTLEIEAATGRRQERNIVARTRLSLEREGLIRRVPGHEHPFLTFELT